ncbi:MAG: carboxypeptidase regulatory-like domain-containing protein [Acidobacteriota bacterium]
MHEARIAQLPLFLFLVCVWLAPSAAVAYAAGSVLGTVTDADGERLAEVDVVLEGPDGKHETRTDAEGRFRFAPLDPGRYSLSARRPGFVSADAERVDVRLGRAVTARVRLGRDLEDTVIVLSEPPLPRVDSQPSSLDADAVGTVPAALDPWAPADGVRSMPPRPASEKLDDVQADSGPVITVLTERREQRRAEVDVAYSDRSWQSSLDAGPTGGDGASDPATSTGTASADRATQRLLDVASWGAEASGPVWRDRLWLWGTYRGEDIERAAVGGQTVGERLDHAGLRLQLRPTATSSVVADFSDTRRRSDGADAGPTRAPEATRLELEPASRAELELTQMLGADSYLSLQAVHHDAALSQLPASDASIVLDAAGIWRGAGEVRLREDLTALRAEVHTTRRARFGAHDLNLGLEYRRIDDARDERWGDSASVLLAGQGVGTPFDLLRLKRDGTTRVERATSALWLQDRIELSAHGHWTLGLGVRVEAQQGRALEGRREANPLFPELLPEAESAGDRALDWIDISPRLSLARAFGNERRTILRAAYGSFASRLDDELVLRTSPLGDAEVLVGFSDLDGDRRFDKREPYELLDFFNVGQPETGAAGVSGAHSADRLLHAERTEELRIGLEHHPTRALELRLDAVARRTTSVLESRRFVLDPDAGERLARADDYVLETLLTGLLPDGTPYATPVYGLREGLETSGGALLVNGDRQRRFEGVELLVNRRLADGWMLRARASWGDWRWHLGPEFLAFDDPTDSGPSVGEIDSADDQGAPASEDPLRYVSGRWAFDVLMLYEVARNRPWGFDLSAHVHGREGYPVPYVATYASDEGLRDVQLVDDLDAFRLDDIITVDLRLAKSLRLGGVRATVAVDALNLFDSSFVLERENRLTSPRADIVQQTTNGRALQIGLRLSL